METTNKAKAAKRPAAADIRGQLAEGHFGAFGQPDWTLADPISITQLVLALSDIQGYDKNPRRTGNPEYANIKASIRSQRGLNNPFNVTRRPGNPHYMVQSGGNTRLAILRELYAETGDEAFNTVHCLFVPWTSEAAVLTAHLVENELRGEMALIDKAYAIQELRIQLEQAHGVLSERRFVKAVGELGFKLSARQVGRLAYALVLDRLIPNTLQGGVSYRQLDTIKNTEKAYLHYCQGKTDQMPALFAQHMASHDGDGFDVDRVRQAIDGQLALLLQVSYQRLSLEIDALLFEEECQQQAGVLWPAAAHGEGQNDPQEDQEMWPEPWQVRGNEQGLRKPDKPKPPDTAKKGMQQRGFTLAIHLAESVGIAHWVLQSEEGLGFTVEEPDQLLNNDTENALWWLLFLLSGQAAASQPVDALPLVAFQVLNDPARLSDRAFNSVVKLMALGRSAKQ